MCQMSTQRHKKPTQRYIFHEHMSQENNALANICGEDLGPRKVQGDIPVDVMPLQMLT